MDDLLVRTTPFAALLAAAVVIASPPARAVPVDTAGATQCQIRGWAMDPDPKGTNIRSGPRGNAPVIGQLAPSRKVAQGEYTSAEFDIIGSKDGWLLIRNPRPASDVKWEPGSADDGRGWIFARLVGMTLASGPLRTKPSREGAVIARLTDTAGVQVVHGCQGEYVEVTAIPLGGQPLRGWSLRPCSGRSGPCAPAE